ncbi:hypothetical protein C0992_009087 [Termitomyces sp. T32_za158]|nr:hypothetical protein C0992_009087 [Termitomyces sp. T32_za158]
MGLTDIPSDRIMDDIDRALQRLCGIDSIRFQGALGHIYYTNDLAALIAQELANPNVRKHLHFYPEHAGNHLSEAWHAARWKDELHSGLTTPMVRINGQDIYIDEIGLLKTRACMPRRWYQRDNQLFANAWHAIPTTHGWILDTAQEHEVAATEFLLGCSELIKIHNFQQLPDPRIIIGETSLGPLISLLNVQLGVQDALGAITPWSKPAENPWRLHSQGHPVLAVPLWLYCDDTSGNQSKKWNKHNSFLFTLAGLPRCLIHSETNIHFLSTSNIAPPLEMLDGIVEQLE